MTKLSTKDNFQTPSAQEEGAHDLAKEGAILRLH